MVEQRFFRDPAGAVWMTIPAKPRVLHFPKSNGETAQAEIPIAQRMGFEEVFPLLEPVPTVYVVSVNNTPVAAYGDESEALKHHQHYKDTDLICTITTMCVKENF